MSNFRHIWLLVKYPSTGMLGHNAANQALARLSEQKAVADRVKWRVWTPPDLHQLIRAIGEFVRYGISTEIF